MDQILAKLGEALSHNALPHAILLAGGSLVACRRGGEALAALILNRPAAAGGHDFFHLQPRNRMRQIGIDEVREVLRVLMETARNEYKVVLIEKADRLHRAAANALLKTLEEPPLKTVFLLTSTKPYVIFPTVRSRCQFFRLAAESSGGTRDGQWLEWNGEFRHWFRSVLQLKTPALYLQMYGLIARFQSLLLNLPIAAVGEEEEEVRLAILESRRRAFREARLGDCLRMVWEISRERLPEGGDGRRWEVQRLGRRLTLFDELLRLLAMNYSETAALEFCLLGLMEIE